MVIDSSSSKLTLVMLSLKFESKVTGDRCTPESNSCTSISGLHFDEFFEVVNGLRKRNMELEDPVRVAIVQEVTVQIKRCPT